MRNVVIIKKVLGPYLQSEGFEYAGYDYYSGWKFKREKEEITHWIFIVKSRWGKELWVEVGNAEGETGRTRPGAMVRLDYFKEDARPEEMNRQYHDEETFKQALEHFLPQLRDHFFPGFERLDEELEKELEKERTKKKATPDMHKRLYGEKEALTEALFKRYKNLSTDEGRMVQSIMNILTEHQDEDMEEFEETLLGLAGFLGDMIVSRLEDCQWGWYGGKENTEYVVFYKTHYQGTFKDLFNRESFLSPLRIIIDAWQEKNMERVQYWYNDLFVERRKDRKALSMKMKDEIDSREENQNVVIRERESMFLGQYQFQCIAKFKTDFSWCRSTPEGNQIIKINKDGRTNEMWLSATMENGRKVEIQDIREGLYPYDRAEYCEYIHEGKRLRNILTKLEEQIEMEFMPALENVDNYLLKWELSPEMEKREFYERDELLKKLKEDYGAGNISKGELPDLIKRVLKENEDSSMEEFGDTLLGLGVLLGEAAIKEIEGSHWLWDKERSACLITYRNEVTGIDPAFSLNYAWQKRKPENVDKLYRDLMEGSYIEDRERGGYDIEER